MSDNLNKMRFLRIKKREHFLRIGKNGIKIVTSGMVVQACLSEKNDIQIGFTVTKRIGGAVVRNRVRRRLREAVRLSPDLRRLNGVDLVFIGRLSTLDRPLPRLLSDLAYSVRRVEKYKTEKRSSATCSDSDELPVLSEELFVE